LIVDSKDIGATGVFDAYLDGEALTFNLKNGNFVDDQPGASWARRWKARWQAKS